MVGISYLNLRGVKQLDKTFLLNSAVTVNSYVICLVQYVTVLHEWSCCTVFFSFLNSVA